MSLTGDSPAPKRMTFRLNCYPYGIGWCSCQVHVNRPPITIPKRRVFASFLIVEGGLGLDSAIGAVGDGMPGIDLQRRDVNAVVRVGLQPAQGDLIGLVDAQFIA